MLKITFYPNDVATLQGFHFKDGARVDYNYEVPHWMAEADFVRNWREGEEHGPVDTQIVIERKPGAYELPKLDRVNSIFG
jgi:hypothetical protein